MPFHIYHRVSVIIYHHKVDLTRLSVTKVSFSFIFEYVWIRVQYCMPASPPNNIINYRSSLFLFSHRIGTPGGMHGDHKGSDLENGHHGSDSNADMKKVRLQ